MPLTTTVILLLVQSIVILLISKSQNRERWKKLILALCACKYAYISSSIVMSRFCYVILALLCFFLFCTYVFAYVIKMYVFLICM